MAAPMMNPIQEYDKYFVQDNSIWGINQKGLEKIEISTTKNRVIKHFVFFVIDNIIYYGIREYEQTEEKDENGDKVTSSVEYTYYYQQNGLTVENIEEIPDEPEQTRIEYSSNNFSITIEDFEGTPVSDLKNIYFKNGVRFRSITGAYEIETGIIFNVSESGIRSKKEGLYFFPLNRTSCSKMKEKGKMYWKNIDKTVQLCYYYRA